MRYAWQMQQTNPACASVETIDWIITHIGELVTPGTASVGPRRGHALGELTIIRDGAVAIAQGRIAYCGPMSELPRNWTHSDATRVLDARDMTVTPGLIDPHTHLVFGGDRATEFEQRLKGASYAEILAQGGGIHHTVAATRAASYTSLLQQARTHLTNMLNCGTTTLEAKSGYGLELETELKQLQVIAQLNREGPLEIIPTFMGAHAVPPGVDADTYTTQIIEDMLPEVAKRGLAHYCDVFCEQGVFSPAQTTRIFAAAQKLGLELRLHADELSDLGGGALAAQMGAASADHLLLTSGASIQALAASNTVAVLLPGTPFFLGMNERAPARAMIEAGVAIALGTDFNPGSCFSESMPMMMTLAALQYRLTPKEALVAATINAAHAIGKQDTLGTLEIGKQADLVIWDIPSHTHLCYHFGVPLARHVFKKGVQVR